MATHAIEILSSSESDSEAKFNSYIEVLEIEKENQLPRRASANPKLQQAPYWSDDSDFEPSNTQGSSNKSQKTNGTAKFVKMEQP